MLPVADCGHNEINLKTNQLRRKLGQTLRLLLRKPVLDGDILSLDPSKLAQLLPERLHEDRATGSSAWIQETYAENFPWLLRLGGRDKEQQRAVANSKGNEFSSSFFFASLFLSRHLPRALFT